MPVRAFGKKLAEKTAPESPLKTARTIRSVTALAALRLASRVFAHHSVPVNIDTRPNHRVTGKLITTKWINPHSRMQVEIQQG
jgi:hypothetical protein